MKTQSVHYMTLDSLCEGIFSNVEPEVQANILEQVMIGLDIRTDLPTGRLYLVSQEELLQVFSAVSGKFLHTEDFYSSDVVDSLVEYTKLVKPFYGSVMISIES